MSGLSLTLAGVIAGARPLLFDIDQSVRNGTCNSVGGSCTATSTTATTTTTGGLEPYTYAWSFVSGDSFTITSPTSSSTTFSKNNAVSGSPTFNGIYKCIVTDDNGNTKEDTVTVNLTFIDLT